MPRSLTIDDYRPDCDHEFVTDDGLRVAILMADDTFGYANYVGSNLTDVIDVCHGLDDGSLDEPWELPQRDRWIYVPRGQSMSLSRSTLRKLLTGQQQARLPRYVLARMAETWQEDVDKHARYVMHIQAGLALIQVSVWRRSRLLARKQLAGVRVELAHRVIDDLVDEAIQEARER
jgi:hypothetical protein